MAKDIETDRIERRTTGNYPAKNITEFDLAFVRHYYSRFGTGPFDVDSDLSNKTRVPGGGGKNAEDDGARVRNYPNCRLASFGFIRCLDRTRRQLTRRGVQFALGRMAQGDYFEFFKEDGKWQWTLQGGHHPTEPIARCARGYASRHAAEKSIRSAFIAMRGAIGKNGWPVRMKIVRPRPRWAPESLRTLWIDRVSY